MTWVTALQHAHTAYAYYYDDGESAYRLVSLASAGVSSELASGVLSLEFGSQVDPQEYEGIAFVFTDPSLLAAKPVRGEVVAVDLPAEFDGEAFDAQLAVGYMQVLAADIVRPQFLPADQYFEQLFTATIESERAVAYEPDTPTVQDFDLEVEALFPGADSAIYVGFYPFADDGGALSIRIDYDDGGVDPDPDPVGAWVPLALASLAFTFAASGPYVVLDGSTVVSNPPEASDGNWSLKFPDAPDNQVLIRVTALSFSCDAGVLVTVGGQFTYHQEGVGLEYVSNEVTGPNFEGFEPEEFERTLNLAATSGLVFDAPKHETDEQSFFEFAIEVWDPSATPPDACFWTDHVKTAEDCVPA